MERARRRRCALRLRENRSRIRRRTCRAAFRKSVFREAGDDIADSDESVASLAPLEGRLPYGVAAGQTSLRVLKERNFALYFVGNFASNCGTWFQVIAQSLLVYRLTKSTFLVGVTN